MRAAGRVVRSRCGRRLRVAGTILSQETCLTQGPPGAGAGAGGAGEGVGPGPGVAGAAAGEGEGEGEGAGAAVIN